MREMLIILKEKVVTTSDNFFFKFSDSCSTNNGGCSHVCTSLRHWKVQCSCQGNLQLKDDGKTCQEGELEPFLEWLL